MDRTTGYCIFVSSAHRFCIGLPPPAIPKKSGSWAAPLIHSCDPKATHSPSPQFNSVHKRPRSARKGPLPPICVHYCGYTGSPAAQQCTQTSQSGAESPDPLICVHYCRHAGPPATQQCTQMPQIDRREAHFSHLCTLSRPRGVARSTTVYTNAPNWRGEALATHLCTLSRPPGAAHGSIVYTNAPKIQQKSHREFGTSSHLSCPSKNAAILSNGMASFPPPS